MQRSQSPFTSAVQILSLLGLLALAPKISAETIGVEYFASASCSNIGPCTPLQTSSGGFVAGPAVLAPFDSSPSYYSPGDGVAGSTDVSGEVQEGMITGQASARVYGLVGEGSGSAATSFTGIFQDTLTANYTGLATFTLVLDSALGVTNNGIIDCSSGFSENTSVSASLSAVASSGGENDASVSRTPCDTTTNSETLNFTVPVTQGATIQIVGELILDAYAYADSSTGDGYSFADPPVSEFYVQDIGGDGTFTSASGHDYTPPSSSPVPEPGTLPLALEGALCLGAAIRLQRKTNTRFSRASQT